MPRRRRELEEHPRKKDADLAARLADELTHDRESGQPFVEEQTFPTGLIRVTVIWDDWVSLPLEDRTAVILEAYERAEGPAFREKIGLATGLTFPEAYAAGLLPFQIITAWRTGDSVTAEQCRDALIEEGASTLWGPDRPQLRFATQDDAEAALKRLIKRLPGSDQVWQITQDLGRVEEWIDR